jgi:hypothetical protein
MAATQPAKLGYKQLGKTGLVVSEVCLGTMTFGTKERNSILYVIIYIAIYTIGECQLLWRRKVLRF